MTSKPSFDGRNKEWTPWYKKSGQMFTHKKNKKRRTHRRSRTILSLIEVVLLCTCVSFSIFILKVLSKRALAGEGRIYDGLRSKVKRMTEVKKVKGGQPHFWTLVLAAESSTGHQMTSSPWPPVTQDSSTAWDHLLINLLFLFVHTPFFPSFFFGLLTHFWEICGFKMAGQT